MKTWLSPHRLDGDMSHCHTGSLAHLHHLAPGGRTPHLSLSPPTSPHSGENQKKSLDRSVNSLSAKTIYSFFPEMLHYV